MSFWDNYNAAYQAGERRNNMLSGLIQQQQDRRVASALNEKNYAQAGNLLAQQGRTDDVMKLQQVQTEQQNRSRAEAQSFMVNAASALMQVPEAQRKAQYAQTIAPTLKQIGMPDDLIAQIGSADMSDQALQAFAGALGVKPQGRQNPIKVAPGERLYDPDSGQEIFAAPEDPLERAYKEAQIGALQGKTDAADAKAAEKAEKAQRALQEQQYKAEFLIGAVDQALSNMGWGEAGFIGAKMSEVPGTKAYDLRESLETIKANLGFQELAAMRAASPTGGALGAIAVQELKALQATVGNLDIGQSEKQLRGELEKIKRHYSRWLDAVQKSQQQPQAGGYSQQDLMAEARRRGLIR